MKKALIPERAKGLDAHDAESAYADSEANVALRNYVDLHMPTQHDVHEAFHTYFTNRK